MMTSRQKCENALKSLAEAAKFAYGLSEDKVYDIIAEAIKKPCFMNTIKRTFEREGAKNNEF